MLKASYFPYRFHFNFEAGTSRGILNYKDSWFIEVWDDKTPRITGIGECSLIEGLSPDNMEDMEDMIQTVCRNINNLTESITHDLIKFPAIRFGLETALHDFKNGGKRLLYPSLFTEGKASIPINGLIWMGNHQQMLERIQKKINDGFGCLKMKVGAIEFDKELELLSVIREEFTPQELELRVDANGAFQPEHALEMLNKLSPFHIHSIEQPIKPKQWPSMAEICRNSPIPIALDEELIGIYSESELSRMLDFINPDFLILKPSLIGGIAMCERFIEVANNAKINWWVTSALESNIGLNAIAQWTYTLNSAMHQGLGTGELFSNNVDAPLRVQSGRLYFENPPKWDLAIFNPQH